MSDVVHPPAICFHFEGRWEEKLPVPDVANQVKYIDFAMSEALSPLGCLFWPPNAALVACCFALTKEASVARLQKFVRVALTYSGAAIGSVATRPRAVLGRSRVID